MEKLYEHAKDVIVNFKLQTCCCIVPVRVGLLIVGYFNILIAFIWLVDTADNGKTPPLMAVQSIILDDDPSTSIGVLAYGTELAFNFLLLCGVYRKDLVLLRVYTYFVIVEVITSLLVYSIVIATTTLLLKLHIMWNLGFQCYVLILVRSGIVEIKEMQSSEKNGHVTLYSIVRTPEELPPKPDDRPDIEAAQPGPSEPEESKETANQDEKKDEPPTKLETVNENVKEEETCSKK